MTEIWKDVPNYEGIYQVSNLGRIKSNYKNNILKPSVDRFGYVRFSATKNKKQRTIRIHRLVIEVFDPINSMMQVNHINGDKKDNRLCNLEWCTDSENKIHAYANGLMKAGNQYTGKTKRDLPRYKLKSTNFNQKIIVI